MTDFHYRRRCFLLLAIVHPREIRLPPTPHVQVVSYSYCGVFPPLHWLIFYREQEVTVTEGETHLLLLLSSSHALSHTLIPIVSRDTIIIIIIIFNYRPRERVWQKLLTKSLNFSKLLTLKRRFTKEFNSRYSNEKINQASGRKNNCN